MATFGGRSRFRVFKCMTPDWLPRCMLMDCGSLLTLNVADFNRYPNIVGVHPAGILEIAGG